MASNVLNRGFMPTFAHANATKLSACQPAVDAVPQRASTAGSHTDLAGRPLDESITRLRFVGSKLPPGTRIDQYVVLRQLGRGAMGEVYLARDVLLGRKAALKIIPREFLDHRDSVERFLFEARATARFNHPNIVTCYGAGTFEERPYVALAYLEGETLLEHVVGRRVPLKEAIDIALSIARALAEAHRHGIAHRDLKPGNVFLGHDGRVQVLDFGIAKQFAQVDCDMFDTVAMGNDEGEEPALAGTPGYMAPEQWRNEAELASDVWALGIILFELCSRTTPFEANDLASLVSLVCSTEPAPRLDARRHVPQRLADLCARCLAKAAHERPSAAEVVAELSQIDLSPPVAQRKGDTQLSIPLWGSACPMPQPPPRRRHYASLGFRAPVAPARRRNAVTLTKITLCVAACVIALLAIVALVVANRQGAVPNAIPSLSI